MKQAIIKILTKNLWKKPKGETKKIIENMAEKLLKKSFKKSTVDEISLMRKLYKENLTLAEIGKRLKRHHTTILYHIKKTDYNPDRKPIRTLSEEEIKAIQKQAEFDANICVSCKKPKEDLRFSKTNFCSANCWHEATKK